MSSLKLLLQLDKNGGIISSGIRGFCAEYETGGGKTDVRYEHELGLLCDTLKRCRVPAAVVLPFEPIDRVIDFTLRDMLSASLAEKPTIQNYLGTIAPCTMYRYTDEMHLCYIYLRLSGAADSSLLFVGPFLSEPLSARQLLELGERVGAPPKMQKSFENFYANIPVLREGASVFVLLDTFCEHIWGSPSFAISNVNSKDGIQAPSIRASAASDGFDETLLHIKTMELRYKFENELMRAVSLGQLHKEKLMLESFSDEMFEKRVSDPLRNAKNYSVIMNTLLRKAAEQGGVHPVYIDKLSSEFAHRIEHMSELTQNTPLMREMFCSYCKLVRKHAIRNFSQMIQKTILLIESDLSTNLSLSMLAKQQSVSPSYLSTLFKKETGKTVSEYIREKRIQYAASLLGSTHLQVQTVALHCGIMDVQYFSKLFKKQMGVTPKEYRENIRAQR